MDIASRRGGALWLVPIHSGDGGVGALRGPHSHPKICYLAPAPLGGAMWESDCLLVWSILT